MVQEKLIKHALVSLDRQIQVISGASDDAPNYKRVSDIRYLPFYVLLGEPGMGKTSVLKTEAAVLNVPVFTVQDVISNPPQPSPPLLFIDALDEFRIDGNARDKAHQLSSAIRSSGAKFWRLSCRAEDWRPGADIAAISKSTDGVAILVAQLMPLDDEEAADLLIAFGEADPKQFMDMARKLGAEGLAENPLSLKLLYKSVSAAGLWPASRFELFERSILALAHEQNIEHGSDYERTSASEIVKAAEQACLRLLITGAPALLRSNAHSTEGYKGGRPYLKTSEVPVAPKVIRDMLDTPLFRGEGEVFVPIHRTIAEFLAGRALAKLVRGGDADGAIPLSRALALITSADGAPPTELRGLYAWFAAHLAKLGDDAGCLSLVQNDAFAIIAYGDVSVFSASSRRAILGNLSKDDPYFRVTFYGATGLGGLANSDLADDFEAILLDRNDRSHVKWTVLEALSQGAPIESLRPILCSIILDPSRSDWERTRALEAWVNGSDKAASHDLFQQLLKERPSVGREAVLVEAATDLHPGWLSTDELKEILRSNDCYGADRVVGRLYSLQKKLEKFPPEDLFDEPVKNWRPEIEGRRGQYEVKQLLDHVLAASIRAAPELQADRLYTWLTNFRRKSYSKIEKETLKAVREWLSAVETRSVTLFEVILNGLEEGGPPYLPIREYSVVTGTHPPESIVNHFLHLATATRDKKAKRAALEMAADLAIYSPCNSDAYWNLYAAVVGVKGYTAIARKITHSKLEGWRIAERRRAVKANQNAIKERQHNISILLPITSKMRRGEIPINLDWFAQQYFGHGIRGKDVRGIDAVSDQVNPEILDALVAGCEYLAREGIDAATPTLLGEREVNNTRYYAELAAVAGLDMLIEKDQLPPFGEMPLLLALFVIKSMYIVAQTDAHSRVLEWAVERLNYSPEEGSLALTQYWAAMIEKGYGRFNGLDLVLDGQLKGPFYQGIITHLFEQFPVMPGEVLRRLIPGTVKILGNGRALEIAEKAIGNPLVSESARQLWILVAFLIAPTRYRNEFISVYSSRAADLRSYDEETIIKSVEHVSEDDRAAVDFGIASALGITVPSSDEDGFVGLAIAMRAAIDRLGNSASIEAGKYLKNLFENPQLISWQTYVQHALAVRQRFLRDANFVHPTPEAANDALNNGPPLNAADLLAVVGEEMRRLQAELRTADNAPWKRFWNSDKDGNPTQPLIENECRNYVLDRLRDRLAKYRVAAVLPEAQRADSTRADMLVLSHSGKNLPIEVKRHYHAAVWEGASTQLQGYSADVGAEGLGIYLVIWFGTGVANAPKRSDGENFPQSATEMEDLLKRDLSPDLRAVVDIIVFDVSKAA